MEENVKQTISACTQGSMDDTLSFPEVVAKLVEAGCEQYHADFRRQEKTYYLPDGETQVEPLPVGGKPIGERFSAEAVLAALQAIQSRKIDYMSFLERIMTVGCVGYFVFIPGRQAIYLGRDGDFHIEQFPAPRP